MSGRDSGVDTGSDDSLSMSVGSPANSESNQEPNAVGGSSSLLLPELVVPPPLAQPTSFYGLAKQDHYFGGKMRPLLLHKKHNARRQLNNKIYTPIGDILGPRRLRVAAGTNDVEIVHELLDDGIDPCTSDDRKRTPLHFAACKGHLEVARVLLERGANPNQKDIVGNTPLHLGNSGANNGEKCDFLNGFDVGFTAACTSHIGMVTLLLKAGTDVNALDNSGRSPLHLAQSKLNLLQDSAVYTSSQLKNEVMQVIEMMLVYLQRSGKAAEVDLLNMFSTRLQLHQTKEEVDIDVKNLLYSLSHLSIKKS